MARSPGWSAPLLLALLGAAGPPSAAESGPAANATRAADPLNCLLPPPVMPDGLPAAEVIEWPPRKAPAAAARKEAPHAPGYKLVLSGELAADLTLGPEQSPVLIRGALVVPAGRTLTLQDGVALHLLPDPVPSAASAGQPPPAADPRADPARRGMLWLYGRLLADGLAGQGVLISASPAARAPTAPAGAPSGAEGAGLYFYGAGSSDLRGVRLSGVDVTQTGGGGEGVVQWLGCEFNDARHYALAGGAALAVHCTFRRCGGVFATYSGKPWGLLLSRCAFDACREGLVLGAPPAADALYVERNNFSNPRGPILRASRSAPAEVLVGENWYGTAEPEGVDARILDRRGDPGLRVRFNTRPPAERPYTDAGAGASPDVLARAYRELAPARRRVLNARGGRTELARKP